MKRQLPPIYLILCSFLSFHNASGQQNRIEEISPPNVGQTDTISPFYLDVQPEADEAEPTEKLDRPSKRRMNNQSLGELLKKHAKNVQGVNGRWKFDFEGVEMLCLTDESSDRMRIITPILAIEDITDEQFAQCMSANFDRALDARYCVNGGMLWGAFIHPLGDLSNHLLFIALHQVAGVKRNFGGTYSSGGLQFGGGDEEPEPEENDPDITV